LKSTAGGNSFNDLLRVNWPNFVQFSRSAKNWTTNCSV